MDARCHGWHGGFMSIPVIDIVGFPADTNTDDFAMLHDGTDFRLYMLRE